MPASMPPAGMEEVRLPDLQRPDHPLVHRTRNPDAPVLALTLRTPHNNHALFAFKHACDRLARKPRQPRCFANRVSQFVLDFQRAGLQRDRIQWHTADWAKVPPIVPLINSLAVDASMPRLRAFHDRSLAVPARLVNHLCCGKA